MRTTTAPDRKERLLTLLTNPSFIPGPHTSKEVGSRRWRKVCLKALTASQFPMQEPWATEAPQRISFKYSNGLNWYILDFSNAENNQNARNLAKMLKGSRKEEKWGQQSESTYSASFKEDSILPQGDPLENKAVKKVELRGQKEKCQRVRGPTLLEVKER